LGISITALISAVYSPGVIIFSFFLLAVYKKTGKSDKRKCRPEFKFHVCEVVIW